MNTNSQRAPEERRGQACSSEAKRQSWLQAATAGGPFHFLRIAGPSFNHNPE